MMDLYVSKYPIALEFPNVKLENSIEQQVRDIRAINKLPAGTVFEALCVDGGEVLMACESHIMNFRPADIDALFNIASVGNLKLTKE